MESLPKDIEPTPLIVDIGARSRFGVSFDLGTNRQSARAAAGGGDGHLHRLARRVLGGRRHHDGDGNHLFCFSRHPAHAVFRSAEISADAGWLASL